MHSSEAFQEISTELLTRGHSVRFRAEGKSMQPTIREGEAIIVEPVAPRDVKGGDILLCRGGRGVVAHRVVAIEDVRGQGLGVRGFRSSIFHPPSSTLSPRYLFILRGDALSTRDAPVESGQVLGRVVSAERNGRSINLAGRSAKMSRAMRDYAAGLKRLIKKCANRSALSPHHSLLANCRRWLSAISCFILAGFLLGLIQPAQLWAQGIGFDAASSSSVSGATSLTFSHTVSGTNRLLIVGVSIFEAPTTVSSITYAGTALTFVGSVTNASTARAEIWRLVAPATGANDVVVTVGASAEFIAGAASFTGVHQTTPLGSFFSATGTSTAPSVNVTGVNEGEVVIDTLDAVDEPTATVGAGQTQRWNRANEGQNRGAGSTEPGPDGGGTVTMFWSLDLSRAWAIGAVALKPANPTAVRLMSFSATDHDDRVLLRWRTGYEVDNLGFHVYREEGGERVRLTPELVAGTALLTGAGTALTAGHSYSWWDDPGISGQSSAVSGQQSSIDPRSSIFGSQSSVTPSPTLPLQGGGTGWGVRYWLEDIDLNGMRTWHGPVTPVVSHEALPRNIKPELMSELGRRLGQKYDDFWKAQDLKEKLRQGLGRAPMRSARLVEQISKPVGLRAAKADGRRWDQPFGQERLKQWTLASRPAVKISVKENGWYRVSRTELMAAGLSSSANPRNLQLYREGTEQAIKVLTNKSSKSETLSAIEFYGEGLDTPSADTRVYWLVEGARAGKRIQEFKGRRGSLAPPSFPFTVEKRDRIFYFAALKNGEAESFFGPLVSTEPVDQILTVAHQDPLPPEDPVLEVALQGLTNVPHRAKVLFNEVEVGGVVFEGQSRGSVKFSLPPSYLLDGDNVVTLVSQGGETDVSLVDEIRLTYWHSYTADSDSLRFTAQGGEQLTIDGFSQTPVRVIDVTDPGAIQEVAGLIQPNGTGYAVTVQVPGQGSRTLLAFTETQVMQVASIISNQPSAWHKRARGADLVIIAHRQFLDAVEPLKVLRQAQGLSVALIDAEDLYDEFNFGAKSPKAIKDFLALTRTNWQRPPRYVLLVGDASFDPKNYLGFGDFDFVPTKLVETRYFKTASDDWFVDLDGNGLPEITIGRLPVRTGEQAARVISKIISYGEGGGHVSREALLVADKNDSFDFERASEEVEALLPASIRVQKIYRQDFSSDAEANSALISSMNEGSLLVNYIGHGSVEILRGMLSSDDAQALTNGARLPFFISMTCLNGLFHDVYTESLAEALLNAEQGGAVAVWASSGLTEPSGQAVMNQELIRFLFNGEPLALGEAVAKAKTKVADPDIRRTWILFGDPSMRLQ